MSLYAPGEMTEGQFATALEFVRMIRVMQDKLSAGVAALDRCGLKVEDKGFDRLFWQLADASTPVERLMMAHIDAGIAKLMERRA